MNMLTGTGLGLRGFSVSLNSKLSDDSNSAAESKARPRKMMPSSFSIETTVLKIARWVQSSSFRVTSFIPLVAAAGSKSSSLSTSEMPSTR